MWEFSAVVKPNMPSKSRWLVPTRKPGQPRWSMPMFQSTSPTATARSTSMPLKKMKIAAASSARQPRKSRTNSSSTSPTPNAVHSGTAQLSAAGPHIRPANAGTMCQPT